MKLALILLFLSYWIHVKAKDNSEICKDLPYNWGNDKDVQNKFKSEYSFAHSAKRTFYNVFTRKGLPSFKIEGNLATFFCVCTFYRLQFLSKVENPDKVENSETSENPEQDGNPLEQSFYEINQETTSYKEKLGIFIWPYSVIYEHHFPATRCGMSGKRYLIAKGPDKEPDQEQYNIYVARITGEYDDEPLYKMEGYIQNVDLKKLQNEIS